MHFGTVDYTSTAFVINCTSYNLVGCLKKRIISGWPTQVKKSYDCFIVIIHSGNPNSIHYNHGHNNHPSITIILEPLLSVLTYSVT